MSTPNIAVPVGIQDVISASLNSTLALNFLMGVYTMVYAGTMYIYLCKRPSSTGNLIVLLAISSLYLLCLMEVVLQWYFLDRLVLNNTNTQNSIYWGALGGLQSQWITRVLNDVLFYALFIVSDGLLIWRCYHVWGKSILAIAIPSLLLIAELCLSLSATIFDALFANGTSNSSAILASNRIESALPFIILGTAVSTTFLIAYRIHHASSSSDSSYRKRFTHIAAMIVESAAAYSLVLLVMAIITALPSSFASLEGPVYIALYYVEAVAVIIAGLAPTVLVARIALRDPACHAVTSHPVTHISAIQFGTQQNSENGGENGATSVRDDGSTSIRTEEVVMPVLELKRLSKANAIVWHNGV